MLRKLGPVCWAEPTTLESGTRDILYPGPVGFGTRVDESTQAKLVCIQGQNY